MNTQSDQITNLVAAIVAAQAQMVPAVKDHINPFFNSKYADLGSVWEALLPFREQGIAIVQSPAESPDGYILLDTQLTHVSGEWMRSRLKMRVTKDDPQGAASALTYARRNALCCMTGLVTEVDDDGNAAVARPSQPSQKHSSPIAAPLSIVNGMSNTVLPYGKFVGLALSDEKINDGYLSWFLERTIAQVSDPSRAKYHESDERLIAAIELELQIRSGVVSV